MKKLLTLLSAAAIMLAFAVCFSASAVEKRVVIDNVVYEYVTSLHWAVTQKHYVVTDFFDNEELADSTDTIKIVDEIDGIKVMSIYTNRSNDYRFPSYKNRELYPNVKKIIIPDTVKYIADYSLTCFRELEEIDLPTDLTEIGEGVFYRLSKLKKITLPEGVRYIDKYTFKGCSSLEEVVVEGYLRGVFIEAFADCEKLTDIKLTSKLDYISDYAFCNTGLKKVVIPAGTELSEGAFSDCKNLEKVVFQGSKAKNKVLTTANCFEGCDNIKAVYFKSPAKAYTITDDILNNPGIENIYFFGSEKLWTESVGKAARNKLSQNNVKINYYYKHTHKYEKTAGPTCIADGAYVYVCICGDSYKSEVFEKIPDNHNYAKWKTTKKATYTEEGSKKSTCTHCGKKTTVVIARKPVAMVLSITSTQSTSVIKLTWTTTVNGSTGYRIYMLNEETGTYEKIASINRKGATYRVTGLESGKSYTFKILPFYKDNNKKVAFGEFSEAYTVSTDTVAM